MRSEVQKQEKQLRRRYHSLAAQLGMTEDDRRVFLSHGWGKESCADLGAHELIDVINSLDVALRERKRGAVSGDKLYDQRRYAYGAIKGYLATMYPDRAFSSKYIMSIGARSASRDSWEQLTATELTTINRKFNAMKKTSKGVEKVVGDVAMSINAECGLQNADFLN